MEQRPKKLLDQACTELCRSIRETIRLKHYSIRTEEAYVNWITRYVLFHNKRHPKDMGSAEACPKLVEGLKPSSPIWP